VHRVLIDCGSSPTYQVIKHHIAALPDEDCRFELLIVTHVDTDHVGGAKARGRPFAPGYIRRCVV
jgi:glyoxylase-like metal-dependent hydrolase (beta-lactamase superfamily II)